MLPLFPLQLVVFPGEFLNLHIFEPRYKQLLNECEEDGITFGIPPFIDGRLGTLGVEMMLLRVEKRYENGELDVRTRGVGLFQVEQFHREAPGKLYPGGIVSTLEYGIDGDRKLGGHLLSMARSLFHLLNINKPLPTDPDSFLSYDIGHYLGLSIHQENELLAILDEDERRKYLISHLEHMLPMVRETEELRKKALLNGHFKNIIPPVF
jgi:ATP-dependent Lon protease